jgi:hypothetical protein
MWFLVLMTIVNAVLHQQAVQNVYRISFGIVQLGILEGVMFGALVWMLIRGGSIRASFPSVRTHPVLFWILGLMLLGGVFGMLGGVLNHNNTKYLLSSAREYLALPLCVIVGYRLLGTPKHVRRMAVCEIIAGVLTGVCLFWAFGEKTEEAQLSGALNPLRAGILHWNSEYAAVTGLVCIFVVMTRYKLWKTPIVILLGLFSYIAYASTLSRSGFLILLLGTASTFMLLPKGERFRKFIRGMVFMPVLFFACWGALNLGDAIIGRGFAEKVNKHFMTLIPSERTGHDEKAWDSRVGGIAA